MADAITQKLHAFFGKFPQQLYPKGTILIDANEQPSGIFYLQEGIIRRYWIFENGNEITLNLYKPHSFLPMSWAIANIPNTHIYAAMTDVIVRKAPKEPVLTLLQENPDIVYDLLRRVYSGLEGLWTHIESLAGGTASTKLVASLVILTKRFGEISPDGIIIQQKLGETAIAEYAGMSRETASRELQKLKKGHFVVFSKGTIVIPDLQKLEKLLVM